MIEMKPGENTGMIEMKPGERFEGSGEPGAAVSADRLR
jgi:hypothetical protein